MVFINIPNSELYFLTLDLYLDFKLSADVP